MISKDIHITYHRLKENTFSPVATKFENTISTLIAQKLVSISHTVFSEWHDTI